MRDHDEDEGPSEAMGDLVVTCKLSLCRPRCSLQPQRRGTEPDVMPGPRPEMPIGFCTGSTAGIKPRRSRLNFTELPRVISEAEVEEHQSIL